MRKGSITKTDDVILFDGKNADEITEHSDFVTSATTIDGTSLFYKRGENLDQVIAGQFVGKYGVYNDIDLDEFDVTVTEEIPAPDVVAPASETPVADAVASEQAVTAVDSGVEPTVPQ